MTDYERPSQLTREVKSQLDGMIVGIELTLISIIQGLALNVLAVEAVEPLINFQFEYWPYIAIGLIAILIFWSRSLIHTLSFIGWPLEFGHNFVYFFSTMIEVALLTQVDNPSNWFALNAVYFTIAWFLYWYDLRVIYAHRDDFQTPSERKLYADIVNDQLINIRLWMPAGVGFHLFAWWLIQTWPDLFIEQKWHVGLAFQSVFIGVWYLYEGIRILRRRQGWIVARYIQERREAFEPDELTPND